MLYYKSMPCSKDVFRSGLLSLLLAACDGSIATDPSLPRRGVEVVVDSAVYHLQPWQYGYQVNLAVTVINDGDHDVYLAQHCGFWGLQRADGNTARLELGAYGCSGESRTSPLRIPAGTRYTKTFTLDGSFQPQARPPVTLDNYIGTVKIRYSFTNPSGTDFRSIQSEPFMVLPPA